MAKERNVAVGYHSESDKLKHSLRISLDLVCHRYLMANLDSGAEKAERHIELCKMFISVWTVSPLRSVGWRYYDLYDEVHTETQELTGYLDEKIGFPLDGSRPDYDKLVPLFFEKFYEIAVRVIDGWDVKKGLTIKHPSLVVEL